MRRRARTAHVTVYAIRVRSVGFNRDNSEAALRNKPLRDRRALGLKLVRAVRSFAEQNEPCVTDKRQQRIVILRAASQRLNRFVDDCRVSLVVNFFCSARTSSAQPKLPLKGLILP